MNSLGLDTDITIFERFLLSVLKEELSEFHRERMETKSNNLRPDFDYSDWEEIYTKYKNTDIEEAKDLMHSLILRQSQRIVEQGTKQ